MNRHAKRAIAKIAAAFGISMALAAQVYAALPAGIATGIDAIEVDALALIDLIWPVVIVVASGMIIFKLFKRTISKV